MAARGARSRKVVEKVIEKEESRRYADRFNSLSTTPDPGRGVVSPVAGWRRKNSVTSGSGAASVWSAESGGSSGKLSGTGAKKIVSRIASVTRPEDRFAAKGKNTAAPRGRGGGVPVKTTESARDRAQMRSVKAGRMVGSSLGMRSPSESTDHSDSSSSLRPWANTKVWSGGIESPKSYKGFEHDDDMWMSDGNCLIFFAEETNEDDPRPMCRIHTKTLEQARSVFMINLLKYGEIVVDEDGQQYNATPTSLPQPNTWPLVDAPLGNLDSMLNDESTLGGIISPIPSRVTSSGTWNSGQTASSPILQSRRINLPVPDLKSNFPDPDSITRVSAITHEIWFRAPSHITRTDIQRRHHLATRNYIALLYGLPIVGSDYNEMLSDLQNVMDTYYELNDPSERWDSAQVLITYLKTKKLDDVRGNLSSCLGLMAWSEQSSVRWEAGYMEGFVHAVGMMNSKTVDMREFKLLSQVSRHKLQNAYNALQLRLIEAEERLANFEFPELWYAEGVAPNQPAQRAYDEFRSFLNCFYSTVWGNWPPKEKDHQKHWLSRSVVNRLQADLGALYDYIVDREITWDASEERHTRKWEMVSNSVFRSTSFHADIPGLPITNMLVGFDSSLRFDHIPHPFPLLPASGSSIKSKPTKKGIFSGLRSRKEAPSVAGPKERYQMALAFNAATNVDRLGTTFKENKLLDTFQHHEKSFPPSILPPTDARLGRWILLYSILQVLSSLSVDVAGLKYSDKIRYFACPSLDGLPPWRSPTHPHHHPNAAPSASSSATPPMRDAAQSMSYCWVAPSRWTPPPTAVATPTDRRPPSSTPPAYEPSPNSTGVTKSPSATLPMRSIPNKNSMAEINERPSPVPRPAIGPRLFPTLAPVGGLAEQRHAFAGGYGSRVGSPLARDKTNAFSTDGMSGGVI